MFRTSRTHRGAAWQATVLLGAALALALTSCSSASPAGQSGEPLPAATNAAADPTGDPAVAPSSAEPVAADPVAGAAGSSVSAAPAAITPADTAVDNSAATAAPADAPVDNAVTITMPGMSYEVSGALRPGIGSITLTNTDDAAHMMAFAHLKDGVTLDQVKAALAKSEDALGGLLAEPTTTSYGTPDLLGAGQSETVTALDLNAGTYVLACFLTAADGMPHWQMGMIGELVVKGDPATDKPADDGTITIDDSAIALPDGFSGHGTYLVTNAGAQPHSLSIARLDDGTPLAQFAGHVGQAMGAGGVVDGGGGVLVGGIDALAPGQSAYLTLDLKAGHYGYISSADMTGPGLPAQSGEFDVR